ncbi:MAG: hypothetical protein ONB23_09280, partial [candidate division KSB1 bacterium]|nr:hypothetical protein [candidate division KSB1 bacterium]
MRLVSAALVLLVAWTGARVCEASTEQAGQALRLTTHPERDAEPAVSPDGRWVAFASRRTDNWDLWARRIDGGVPFPITDHPAIDRRPRWTHDGHGLLFVSTRDDPEGDLFLVEVKRRGWTCWTVGQPRRLTPRFGLDGDPDPHPKGGKLAFISDRAGQVEIWLLYLGNLHVRRLVRGPVWNPRWSPDGRWLAWIGKARGRPSVILCPYDARRDTLAGTPDTLSTPDNRPVLAFDFDPGQRYLACLLGKQGSADSAGSDVFLLPLPERVSLRGKGSPSALDSLPPCPYRLTFHSEPLGDVAWRHGSLVYHTQEGEILGVPFRGRVPVFHTAGEQLDWANRNARAPTPFDVEDPRVPPRRELELRAEALTRVLEYFPEDTARVAEALFHRANVFHLMGEPTEARQDLARLEKLAEREPQWKWGGRLLRQDIECVRPGRSILFPEAVTGGPGDTAQYLSLARSEDCPPSLRLFALLRAAQVALACGDSVRARKWAGE